MSEFVDCDGCELPMKHPFAVYEPVPGEQVTYCLPCEFVRYVRGLDPGDHEPGTLSDGTYTMRQRGRDD